MSKRIVVHGAMFIAARLVVQTREREGNQATASFTKPVDWSRQMSIHLNTDDGQEVGWSEREQQVYALTIKRLILEDELKDVKDKLSQLEVMDKAVPAPDKGGLN